MVKMVYLNLISKLVMMQDNLITLLTKGLYAGFMRKDFIKN